MSFCVCARARARLRACDLYSVFNFAADLIAECRARVRVRWNVTQRARVARLLFMRQMFGITQRN